jgi:hypothetical protein
MLAVVTNKNHPSVFRFEDFDHDARHLAGVNRRRLVEEQAHAVQAQPPLVNFVEEFWLMGSDW